MERLKMDSERTVVQSIKRSKGKGVDEGRESGQRDRRWYNDGLALMFDCTRLG